MPCWDRGDVGAQVTRRQQLRRIVIHSNFLPRQGSHRVPKDLTKYLSMTISLFSISLPDFAFVTFSTKCREFRLSGSLLNFLVVPPWPKKHTNFVQFVYVGRGKVLLFKKKKNWYNSGGEIGKIPWLNHKIPWLWANFSGSMTFPWPISFIGFPVSVGTMLETRVRIRLVIRDFI